MRQQYTHEIAPPDFNKNQSTPRDAPSACTSAAGHGYETIFVRYGAGVFEERGACALEGGELREVGVYAGLQCGGGGVDECEV